MELTPVERMQLKNQVERILHIQGNYTGGILEIAVVLDYDMPLPVLREKAAGILKALKLQGEVFRNIRLNVVKWISDECIVKEVSSAFDVQTGRVFEDYEACQEQKKTSQKSPETETPKSLDGLAGQLKLFYARSKLILILTEGSYRIQDVCKLREAMQPFLHRKMLLISSGQITPGTRLLLQSDS